MASYHLVLPGSIRTGKSSNKEEPNGRPHSSKSLWNSIAGYYRAFSEINDYVRSLQLLIEEAETRAKKPWYQRLPDDPV